MDPNACLQMLKAAITGRCLDDALEHAENLLEWLRKGGFPPTGWSRQAAIRMSAAIAGAADMADAAQCWFAAQGTKV